MSWRKSTKILVSKIQIHSFLSKGKPINEGTNIGRGFAKGERTKHSKLN